MKPATLLSMRAPVAPNEKRRRTSGDGRIWLRGTTWWIQYYVRGRQVRESSKTPKKMVAEELLRRRLVEVEDGEVAAQRLSYEQLRDALYADYETHDNKSLFTRKDGTRYLGPVPALDDFFSGFTAQRITPDAMKDFIRLRQKAGASNSNINHALRLLRRMFWLLQVEESRHA
jgi:hypothetical protein